jgi:hypothetical protein
MCRGKPWPTHLGGEAFATSEIWENTLKQAHLDEKKLAMTLGKVIFLETAAIGTDAYRTGKGNTVVCLFLVELE